MHARVVVLEVESDEWRLVGGGAVRGVLGVLKPQRKKIMKNIQSETIISSKIHRIALIGTYNEKVSSTTVT